MEEKMVFFIPFRWIWESFNGGLPVISAEDSTKEFIKGKNLWHLLIGEAQLKMKWYHTYEELIENLTKMKLNERS